MPSTIKKIQAENKDFIDDIINIKVVKKLANDNFVVADETGHSLLRTPQDSGELCVQIAQAYVHQQNARGKS